MSVTISLQYAPGQTLAAVRTDAPGTRIAMTETAVTGQPWSTYATAALTPDDGTYLYVVYATDDDWDTATAVGYLDLRVKDGEAVEDAAVSVTVAPLQATAILPLFATAGGSEIHLSMPQHGAGPFIFVITDGEGEAVDLTGKTLRLVAHDYAGNVRFTVEAADIAIGGDDGNQATVQIGGDATGTAGAWLYKLWNVTDKQVLASGAFTVKVAPISA